MKKTMSFSVVFFDGVGGDAILANLGKGKKNNH